MDYEQKYNKALQKIRELIERGKEKGWTITSYEKDLEKIFPELKKSEDERIRKELIKETEGSEERLFETVTNEEFIAWLEKQGSQKLANSAKTCKDEQKSTDKVNPKFKVGDWVVYTGYLLKYSDKEIYVMQVASIEDGRYIFTDTSTLCFDSEKDMRVWTTKDAKDGDVLASNSSVFIFQEEYIAEKPIAYCGIMNGRFIKGEDVCWTNERYYPATKEQRDTLIKAMTDAGWEWDAKKKELKKIEQKSAWSEEDESIALGIESLISCASLLNIAPDRLDTIKNWLKSIRKRIEGKYV